MKTLEFWPPQSHHLLIVGEQEIHAGETFQVSEEDAEELLTAPGTEVREPDGGKPAAERTADSGDSDAESGDDAEEIPHGAPTQSPHRAERPTPTT